MGWKSVACLVAAFVIIAGCTSPDYPENVVIRVINQTSVAGAFHYEGEGTSGDSTIPACGYGNGAPINSAVPAGNETDFVLGPGPWQITIAIAGQTLVATITPPPTGQLYTGYLVSPSGRISRLYAVTGQEEEPTWPPGC